MPDYDDYDPYGEGGISPDDDNIDILLQPGLYHFTVLSVDPHVNSMRSEGWYVLVTLKILKDNVSYDVRDYITLGSVTPGGRRLGIYKAKTLLKSIGYDKPLKSEDWYNILGMTGIAEIRQDDGNDMYRAKNSVGEYITEDKNSDEILNNIIESTDKADAGSDEDIPF